MNDKPSRIEGAPGLTWRKLKFGWECRWRARTDLVQRGYIPKYARLFSPTAEYPEPSLTAIQWITDRANALQDDMLTWGRGGIAAVATYDGTWKSLVACYQTDPDSTYHKGRFNTRTYYDTLCRRIVKDCGSLRIAETDARKALRLYEQWSDNGKKAPMGHSVVGMMRSLATFGATMLKWREFRELKVTLHDMRFTGSKAREERLTAEMADAIRALAPSIGHRSISIAQALQYELMLRQADVLGQWNPISEPGVSDVIDRGMKWLRGVRWEELGSDMILRHVTSKRQKMLEVDLTLAPMVMEELRFVAGIAPGATLRRDMLPASGPVVVCEHTGLPWRSAEFRRKWRALADGCRIPKTVRNMDSRAGAISEATDAGAELEHVRHAATHSDIGMTQRYSRGSQDKIAKVMRLRAQERGKTK